MIIRLVIALEAALAQDANIRALVEAAVEDGCTFAQIGLELRSECGFDAGEAIECAKYYLGELARYGNRPAQRIMAQTFFHTPQQLQ